MLPVLVIKCEKMSPEVQNWGISGPIKGHLSTKFFLKSMNNAIEIAKTRTKIASDMDIA